MWVKWGWLHLLSPVLVYTHAVCALYLANEHHRTCCRDGHTWVKLDWWVLVLGFSMALLAKRYFLSCEVADLVNGYKLGTTGRNLRTSPENKVKLRERERHIPEGSNWAPGSSCSWRHNFFFILYRSQISYLFCLFDPFWNGLSETYFLNNLDWYRSHSRSSKSCTLKVISLYFPDECAFTYLWYTSSLPHTQGSQQSWVTGKGGTFPSLIPFPFLIPVVLAHPDIEKRVKGNTELQNLPEPRFSREPTFFSILQHWKIPTQKLTLWAMQKRCRNHLLNWKVKCILGSAFRDLKHFREYYKVLKSQFQPLSEP